MRDRKEKEEERRGSIKDNKGEMEERRGSMKDIMKQERRVKYEGQY